MKKYRKKTQKKNPLKNSLRKLPNKNKYSHVNSKLSKSKTNHKKTKKRLNKIKRAGNGKIEAARLALQIVKDIGKTHIENELKKTLKNAVNATQTKNGNNPNKNFDPASSYINDYKKIHNDNSNIPSYNNNNNMHGNNSNRSPSNIPSYNIPSYNNNNNNNYNEIVKNTLKNYENE
jgi:hypothetical protein